MKNRSLLFLLLLNVSVLPAAVVTDTPASLYPLSSVRLLESPFTRAAEINREYLLALDPDRLLAPFFREAGLQPRKPPYGNWESGGLDGHTAGHYLSALANMIAAGEDTPDGELRRRLGHMLDELALCQKANGDGYIGGVPGSRELWAKVAAGDVGAVGKKWVPWYNLHKTYAGLRDACVRVGDPRAQYLLIRFGDWCVNLLAQVPDEKFQQMLGNEYGGMNETLADIYALTGDQKYLDLAKRFNHRALLEPLSRGEDKLTGLHANTQIPKIVGAERIATLSGDASLDRAARFFWETVTRHRSVAFGGNSVSEHFNSPDDFHRMLEHREGPETCNTYNMLRLTEQLFAARPDAAYADYYERALYNHILASINPRRPGFVYFTPIRPAHYRVYSQPDQCFWCCVGTGMENPGRYGEFIYAKADDGVYVNLFIPSEIRISDSILLRQETRFPYEARTRLVVKTAKPATFTLHVRHPAWVDGGLPIRVNGKPARVTSAPSTFAELRREWRDGDTVDIGLPMQTTVERLPDGSDWAAILRGPILLASPAGNENLTDLWANDARMGHVASGPFVPLDEVPSLLVTADRLPSHVRPDPGAGPLRFRLKDVIEPASSTGLPLIPFFELHEQRYQMYWELTTKEKLAERREKLVADERAKAAREAATIDWVAIGEQQPEVEHDLTTESSKTGTFEGRRWRDGGMIQYTFNTGGHKAAELEVTYFGGDSGRAFDIFANGVLIGSQELEAEARGKFIEKRYVIPADVLVKATDKRLVIRFVSTRWTVGGIFGLRLMKPDHAPRSATR